jgi:hypothetical protein
MKRIDVVKSKIVTLCTLLDAEIFPLNLDTEIYQEIINNNNRSIALDIDASLYILELMNDIEYWEDELIKINKE